jgi:hypothetical protein
MTTPETAGEPDETLALIGYKALEVALARAVQNQTGVMLSWDTASSILRGYEQALKEGAILTARVREVEAQLAAATERAARVDLLEIPKQPGLDPIRAIFLDHEPGKGTLIVQCYNEAWTCYFGAMGKRTLREFVATVDRGYLGGAMRCGNATYRERVANAVILSCRAALAAAAPTDAAGEGPTLASAGIVRTCCQHSDCDEADARALARGLPSAHHSYDDGAEENDGY